MTGATKHTTKDYRMKQQGKEGFCPIRQYHQIYYRSRGLGGEICRRDAAVADLPPLPVLCRKKERVNIIGCDCSRLTKSTEYQKQLRGHYTSWVRKSTVGGSGNELLLSYITPPLKQRNPSMTRS